MALYTNLKVIEEAQDLRFDVAGEKVQGLHACIERAAELTGCTPLSLKRLFWTIILRLTVRPIADTSKRGRGSYLVDKASLYKMTPEQATAINAFVQLANSSEGAAKVNPSHPTPAAPR
jgi:hypothetical protein